MREKLNNFNNEMKDLRSKKKKLESNITSLNVLIFIFLIISAVNTSITLTAVPEMTFYLGCFAAVDILILGITVLEKIINKSELKAVNAKLADNISALSYLEKEVEHLKNRNLPKGDFSKSYNYDRRNIDLSNDNDFDMTEKPKQLRK